MTRHRRDSCSKRPLEPPNMLLPCNFFISQAGVVADTNTRMAAPAILALPYRFPTLWDEILESLDLASVKNLRLTNKALASGCIHPRFTRSLSPVVRQLEWLKTEQKKRNSGPVEEDAVVKSLARSLRAFGKLDSVELNAAVVDEYLGCRKSTATATEISTIREHANRCYLAVIGALESSGIVVESFSLFRDTPCVGLEMDCFSYHTIAPSWGMGYEGMMTSITDFAVSIVVEVNPVGNGSNPWPDGTPLAWVLEYMPNLKTLDIRFFSRDSEPHITTRIFLGHRETTRLVQFLQARPSIQQLDLEEINLLNELYPRYIDTHPEPGDPDPDPHQVNDWASLIPYMVGIPPFLTKLRLSSLVQIGGTDYLFNLYPVWATFVPALRSQMQNDDQSYFSDHGRLVHTLVLKGDELKKDLVFFRTI
ncbi:hypothetical protein B0T22DRAFT_519023, partial [Podospora appendiculata]